MEELIEVFNFSSDDMTHYLNMVSGKIAMYSNLSGGFDEDGNEIQDAHVFQDDKYIEITGMHAYESYRDMEKFNSQQEESELKEQLIQAVNNKGPFKRFREVLDRHPEASQKWQGFKRECVIQRIYLWLDENNLVLEEDS